MASFLSQSAQKGAVEEKKPEEEKTDIPQEETSVPETLEDEAPKSEEQKEQDVVGLEKQNDEI